eukprot:12006660-Heterocapsa_arctica.AAC.1
MIGPTGGQPAPMGEWPQRPGGEVRPDVHSFMEVAAKLVDLRGVARPPSFSGNATDWTEFKFRLESVAALLELDGLMEKV